MINLPKIKSILSYLILSYLILQMCRDVTKVTLRRKIKKSVLYSMF